MRRLLLGLLTCAVGCTAVAAEPAPAPFDAEARVQSIMQHNAPVMGNKQAIIDNLANPMLGSGPMKSFDGHEFSASVGCKSSMSFLQMMATPTGTGDLGRLDITQDLDMDGTPDRLYTPPIPISGVCANGVISCDVGTWDNCRSFKWNTTPENGLLLEEVAQSTLGGCYCINNNCGNGLYIQNMERILSDLGGGAAATLAARDANLAISRTLTSGPIITFFGQKSDDCASASNGDLAQYFSNPQNLNAEAFSAAAADTTYQTIMTSEAANQSDESLETCTIERNITVNEVAVDDIIHFNAGTGSIAFCGTNCIQLVLGQEGDNYWPGACTLYENSVSFEVLQPDLIRSATLTESFFDDWIQVRAKGQVIFSGPYNNWNDNPVRLNSSGRAIVPGSCELETSWHQTPDVDFTALIKQPGTIDFSTHVVVSGNGEGYTLAKILVDTRCEANPDEIHDHCAALRDNPDCTLVEEDVDNVQVYADYAPTGLNPLPSTVSIPGSSCSIPVTRDWWLKKKTYRCVGNRRYTFDSALARVNTIETSLTPAGAFSDQRIQADGSTTTAAMNVTLPDMPEVAPCEQACKTRKPRVSADTAEYGPVTNQRDSPIVYDYFYHTCQNDACPIGTGESLVTDCSCINEFQEVTATMQAMRLAGQDMICTTGAQNPPPSAP